MVTFYQEVVAALEGDGGALLSIVEASGSAPRGIGARMLVRAAGGAVGTVGGGAVEHAAQQLAAEVIARQSSMLREYRLSPNQVSDLGMVCGGNITIYIHYLPPGDPACLALYGRLAACCAENIPCTLVTAIDRENCTVYLAGAGSPCPPPAAIHPELDTPVTRAVEVQGVRYVLEPVVAGDRVLIFGAGHVGRELSWFLRRLGFYNVMLDDRADFLTAENLPTADRREHVEFSAAIPSLGVCERDMVVIMTRGHLHDLTILRDALGTPARYIGMIGSKSKIAATFRKLREEGFTDGDLERVKAPIGLALGGKTPEEVALSVAAELVRVRHGLAVRG